MMRVNVLGRPPVLIRQRIGMDMDVDIYIVLVIPPS